MKTKNAILIPVLFLTGCATQSYMPAITASQQAWQPAYNASAVVADNMQNAQTISAQILAVPQQISAIRNMWSGGFSGW